MKKYYELGPFTIFDVETTGMSAVNDRIVEIIKKIQAGEMKADKVNYKLFADIM